MVQRSSASNQQAPKRVIGRPFPPGVSGNPLGRARRTPRFAELYDGIAADYGGPAALTTLQRTVLAQGVRLMIRAERAQNADMAVRLTHAAARMLAALQHNGCNVRKAPPKPPTKTLAEHLAQMAQTSGGAP
jgi:hypothetical protein